MKKFYAALAALCCTVIASAQVSLTTPNGSYAQDFNGMASSGTSSAYPDGWTAIRFAGSGTVNAVLTPGVDNGASNAGNVYSIGSTASTDRALGTLASGSTVPAFGASFINNTGADISSFQISAFSEQWRSGSSTSQNETIVFEYSLDATSLSTGTWTTVSSLNLTELLTSTTFAAAVDGNLASNRVAISGNINAISLPSGSTIWIRWKDADNTGSDGNYALDDFELSYTNTAGNSVSISSSSNAGEPSANGSFTISFSTPTTASTDIGYALGGAAVLGTDYSGSFSTGSTASSSGTLTVPAGTSSVTLTLAPIDDAAVEGTESISLTLSSPTNGYSLGTSFAEIDLADDDAAPTVSVSSGNNAAEPATNGTFNISLSSPAPAGGVTINYSLGGTATAGTDYAGTGSGSITIAEGNSAGVLTITVTDDATVEATETISITLDNADAGYTIGGANASINLTDDDVAPASPISLTGLYTQDFNTLASSGQSSLLPTGWLFSESGTAANSTYNTGSGSSNTGDTYSFGNSSDRALGTLQSGSNTPTIGAFMTNNTGSTITSLRIAFTGEQWRLGTTGRTDRLDFQWSTDATSLTSGTWTDIDQLDFSTPTTTGSTGALDGNSNTSVIDYTITGLNIPAGSTFYIRWNDLNASGADDGLAIDDLTIEPNPTDLTAPVLQTLAPANGATGVSISGSASLAFNEAIMKGAGSMVIRRTSDNTVFQVIDVSGSQVNVSGNTLSFPLSGLAFNTGYYIEVDNGAITDLAGNAFAGFSGNTNWSFTTGTALFSADFQNCSSSISDGFTQYSVTGAQVWACTSFGRDPLAPAGTAAYPYGVQINGFANNTNVPNVDWLISPSVNLAATDYPLLSFWSRNAFNGLPLQLKISTDYTGGDPALATWTDLNGKFPAQASNIWTLSDNINLAAFKQPNVHFAFVYTSTDDDGARWTMDDIRIDNSATPPPPSITLSTNSIQYTFVAAGATGDKTFTFTGNDINSDVTVSATSGFEVSKDGSTFASSVNLTQAEANNIAKTISVRFAPAQANQQYTGEVHVVTSGLDSVVNLKGSSIDPAMTLEIVNWNIEWFGSTVNGPVNDNQQEANVGTILRNIGADIFGLVEVVDESRLANIVSTMPGYSYVVGQYGSHVNPPDLSGGPLSEAQKLGFVYKTSVFSNITTRPLINNQNTSSTSYSNWASGRYPFLMNADVTLGGQTVNINFILVHAKANTSPTATSYARREAAANELHDTLMTYFPTANVIVLGDFNDDLDQSITAGFTTTSYHSFTTDNANFFSPTLALSLAGKKSTVSYNDVIDHVMLSNEMQQYYMTSTANILTDVSSLVTNYGNTTTDHYPVFTRFAFDPGIIVLPVKLFSFEGQKEGEKVTLTWATDGEINASAFEVQRSADGRNYETIGQVNAAGNSSARINYHFQDVHPFPGNNYYRLRIVDRDGHAENSSVVRIDFSKAYTFTITPNPASSHIVVTLSGAMQEALLEIVDLSGRTIKTQTVNVHDNKVNVSQLAKGMYLVRVKAGGNIYTDKLIIE